MFGDALSDYLILAAIGFGAQIIDGALGMAFGVISTTALLTIGIAPAQASAIVHTAEIFTTGASAASHIYHRNVDWRLVMRLGIAGVLGAILGAWILSNVDAAAARPFVAIYLAAIGIFILFKAPWRDRQSRARRPRCGRRRPASSPAFSTLGRRRLGPGLDHDA